MLLDYRGLQDFSSPLEPGQPEGFEAASPLGSFLVGPTCSVKAKCAKVKGMVGLVRIKRKL